MGNSRRWSCIAPFFGLTNFDCVARGRIFRHIRHSPFGNQQDEGLKAIHGMHLRKEVLPWVWTVLSSERDPDLPTSDSQVTLASLVVMSHHDDSACQRSARKSIALHATWPDSAF